MSRTRKTPRSAHAKGRGRGKVQFGEVRVDADVVSEDETGEHIYLQFQAARARGD